MTPGVATLRQQLTDAETAAEAARQASPEAKVQRLRSEVEKAERAERREGAERLVAEWQAEARELETTASEKLADASDRLTELAEDLAEATEVREQAAKLRSQVVPLARHFGLPTSRPADAGQAPDLRTTMQALSTRVAELERGPRTHYSPGGWRDPGTTRHELERACGAFTALTPETRQLVAPDLRDAYRQTRDSIIEAETAAAAVATRYERGRAEHVAPAPPRLPAEMME